MTKMILSIVKMRKIILFFFIQIINRENDKKSSFFDQNDIFLAKNDQILCKNLYWKSLIYLWNAQKVITLNHAKNDCKKLKNKHFREFSCNFPICMWTKSKIMSIFYMKKKTAKNNVKKLVKNGKLRNFQKSLKSSIQLQITFWIAEKIAIECLNPNPKIEKKIIMPMFGKMNFSCHGCVFYHFWKSEKIHFCS